MPAKRLTADRLANLHTACKDVIECDGVDEDSVRALSAVMEMTDRLYITAKGFTPTPTGAKRS